jgi:prepilin-type N-terminal cleavage/methylation domain-containing protein
MSAPRGVTLVELLAVIAILGGMTALSSVALRRIEAPHDAEAGDVVRTLRRDAIAAGRSITRVVWRDSVAHVVTALADGRVIADSSLRVDPSTGFLTDATR